MATIFTLDPGWNWLYHWYIQVNDVVVWPVARGVSGNLSVVNENMEVGLVNGKFTYYTRIRNHHASAVAFEFALTLPEYLSTFRSGIEPPQTGEPRTTDRPPLAIVDGGNSVIGTLPRMRVAQAAGRRPAEQSDRAQGVTVLELTDDLGWRDGEDVNAFHARLTDHVAANRSALRRVDTILPHLVPVSTG
jgi:hypothetical protein